MENSLNEQIDKIKKLSGIDEGLRGNRIEITQDIHLTLDNIEYYSQRLLQVIKKDNYSLDYTQLADILGFANNIKRESDKLSSLSKEITGPRVDGRI